MCIYIYINQEWILKGVLLRLRGARLKSSLELSRQLEKPVNSRIMKFFRRINGIPWRFMPEVSTTSVGLVAVTGILFSVQNCYIIVSYFEAIKFCGISTGKREYFVHALCQ